MTKTTLATEQLQKAIDSKNEDAIDQAKTSLLEKVPVLIIT